MPAQHNGPDVKFHLLLTWKHMINPKNIKDFETRSPWRVWNSKMKYGSLGCKQDNDTWAFGEMLFPYDIIHVVLPLALNNCSLKLFIQLFYYFSITNLFSMREKKNHT